MRHGHARASACMATTQQASDQRCRHRDRHGLHACVDGGGRDVVDAGVVGCMLSRHAMCMRLHHGCAPTMVACGYCWRGEARGGEGLPASLPYCGARRGREGGCSTKGSCPVPLPAGNPQPPTKDEVLQMLTQVSAVRRGCGSGERGAAHALARSLARSLARKRLLLSMHTPAVPLQQYVLQPRPLRRHCLCYGCACGLPEQPAAVWPGLCSRCTACTLMPAPVHGPPSYHTTLLVRPMPSIPSCHAMAHHAHTHAGGLYTGTVGAARG